MGDYTIKNGTGSEVINYCIMRNGKRIESLEAQELIDSLQSQLDEATEACEAATGILFGHKLPGNSPLVLMARKSMRELDEAREQLEAARRQCERYEAALNPLDWDYALVEAWHTNIPDTIKAFEALRQQAKGERG